MVLLELQLHACEIALLCPCVNKDTDVSLILKKRIEVGDVLLPLHALLPFRDVDWTALRGERVVFVTVEANTKRCHKSHQLDGGKIVLASHHAYELLKLQRVDGRKLVLALCYGHKIDCRLARKHEA